MRAPIIAVVAPAETDAAMDEALNRFRGEAAAVGFEVKIVPAARHAPPTAQMESAAEAVGAVAMVAFVRAGDPTGLDVWFTDRTDGRTNVDHVVAGAGADDRAVVLAVKAIDVLRARMFGLLARRNKPAPPPPTPPRSEPPASRPPAPAAVQRDAVQRHAARRLGLSAGVGALRSTQGLGTSLMFVVRAGYGITSWSALRLTVGGMGTEPVLSGDAGRSAVSESTLALEWELAPWRTRLQPMLVAGAGAHYFRATGTPVPSGPEHTVRLLAGAAQLSVGVRAVLSSRLAACLEAGALLLFPQVQLSAGGADARRTGHPTLMATLTMEARL